MESIPDLSQDLRTLEVLQGVPLASCTGARRWWGGGLDVEGLALGAVQATATALNALTGSAGRYTVAAGRTAAAFDSLGHLRIDGRTPQGFAPMSGFRRTRDGWIRLHANYPHHAARILAALSVSTPVDADRVLLDMTSREAEDTLADGNAVAAAVRTRAEWVTTSMHAASMSRPWISFCSVPAGRHPRTWVPADSLARPLEALRILDLTRVIAGPIATRLLGALGADVLRIDPPALPELMEAFVDSGFDKRSALADLGAPEALASVNALLATADVVVTGYRGGGLDRFGMGSEELLARYPGLVVVSLSAWGSDGPWARRRGFDSLVQAATGIAAGYGRVNDDGWQPGALPVQALDHATGYGLAAAVLALLADRIRTGAGGSAQLSLARTAEELWRLPPGDPAVHAAAMAAPEYHVAGSPYGPLRFVGPPLEVDGVPLRYTNAPVRYGSSTVAWL